MQKAYLGLIRNIWRNFLVKLNIFAHAVSQNRIKRAYIRCVRCFPSKASDVI